MADPDEKETVLAAARARHATGELFAKTTAGHLAAARHGGGGHARRVGGFLTENDEEPVEAPKKTRWVWCGEARAPDTPEAEG